MSSPTGPSSSASPSASAPLRVLIIDDDPTVRRVCKALLEFLGHTVAEAVNGVEGLAVLPCFEPDVVLLDMIMPEKDGIETLREIRAFDSITPIIAMSGGSRIDAVLCLRLASHLGAPLVLHKPFTADELDALLALAMERRAEAIRACSRSSVFPT